MSKLIEFSDDFIERFLFEVRHRSGLPLINPISKEYLIDLLTTTTFDDMLDYLMDKFITDYMITAHNYYNCKKTWKSYDW